jgi:membrane-bound serine protease (ClpP class)
MKRTGIGMLVALLATVSWSQDVEVPEPAVIPNDAIPEEATPAEDAKADIIVVCPIEGDIEPGVQVLVERAVEEARKLNAKAIIFKVNTFGGRVDSAVEIADIIGRAPCETIAFIEGKGAISAGALISFSCDRIIMTDEANIGAATPVFQTSDGMETASEKSISFMRAKMRALAEANGHNPDIAQAMVDKDIELRGYVNELGKYVVYAVDSDGNETSKTTTPDLKPIQDVIDTVTENLPIDVTVTPKDEADDDDDVEVGTVVYEDGSELVWASGKLLTLTPAEAKKYGVIETTVQTYDEAVTYYLLGGGTYHIVEPNWAELTFRFLTSPTIAGLLLMLGMGGLYLEVRTPGFGFPGIIGIVCLCLFFGSHFVLGMAETIDIVLVMAGIALILIEIFIIPGFGLAGIAGGICLVVGTYLSLVNFTIPEFTWQYDRLDDVAYSFAVFVVSSTALIVATWKLMPMMPFYGRIVLSETMSVEAGYIAQDMDEAAAVQGLVGVAVSPLRPTGKGRFEGKKYDVMTRGEFIEVDSAIQIIQTDGNRYVVIEVKKEA